MRRCLTSASLCIVCIAVTASAQTAEPPAVVACQTAADEAVRGSLFQIDSMRFSPSPRLSQKKNSETVVQGAGHFQHRSGSAWHRFTYICTYDARSGDTPNVTIRFGSNAADRRGSRRGRAATGVRY